jgi:hypothetical protein
MILARSSFFNCKKNNDMREWDLSITIVPAPILSNENIQKAEFVIKLYNPRIIVHEYVVCDRYDHRFWW